MSDDTQKIQSPIFKWFERMKESYEQSIQSTLNRFESYNLKQQERIDNAHDKHIEHLKEVNKKQAAQYNMQIEQLHKDVNYYRQQLDKQQHIINEANTRYDNMLSCILPNKSSNNIKDIFSEHDFLTPIDNDIEYNIEIDKREHNTEIMHENTSSKQQPPAIDTVQEKSIKGTNQNELFDQAIQKRSLGENIEAFLLFEQSAKLGHAKSMGAMGRAFFLGEGVDENQCLGLAWLIVAANLKLPQAIDRVKHFSEEEPELYQEAMIKSEQLL
jgi:hypothetical protein